MAYFNISLLLFAFLLYTSAVFTDIIDERALSRFRAPKNIVFGSVGGGSSHQAWVLQLLEEAHHRGHKVSFYSKGDQLRVAKEFPMIETRQVGGLKNMFQQPSFVQYTTQHTSFEALAQVFADIGMINYTPEFEQFATLFKSENINLVICDHFAISCIDAAVYLKLPVIITSTFGLSSELDAPFVNNSLLYNTLVSNTIRTYHPPAWKNKLNQFLPLAAQNNSYEKTVMNKRHAHIPRLLNNVFGIEPSRNYGPLVHMMGPVIKKSYASLDSNTKLFLENHKRVAFIAFGQHATPSDKDIKLILYGLTKLLKEGHIDGVIWTGIDRSKLLDEEYSHIYLMDWAPQFAILQHPSTQFFMTHGGVGSLHESLYLGKRVLVFPFFGDQPLNAINIEKNGLGTHFNTIDIKYDMDSYELFYKKINQIAVDPENIIQENVNRFSSFMQIKASRAISNGVDVIEEGLFASDSKGQLTHRQREEEKVFLGEDWINGYNILIILFTLFVFKMTVLPVKIK